MFKKILVANRGEIACRIINTLRSMKIRSVAIYSEIDSNSLHVEMADEAFLIGGAESKDSYLSIKNILEAVRLSKADAVHPGYGFLSENFSFVKALEQQGITFIGPTSEHITIMGDKIQAKNLAIKAGLKTIPGSDEKITNIAESIKLANSIGFPIILKAAAGGGGKGMRIVKGQEEFESAFNLAKNEAISSFNDGRIFLEKFIEEPHHIEIQIVGDKFGNIIHVNERECSIQRRHQKVLEESPSPFLDKVTRSEMLASSINLGREVKYYSAGTIEFLVDKYKNFYFLEMNTRIQVEHPVSEMVTGIDLIEIMIRVSANEKLDIKQSDLTPSGHAIEVRLYAEDPLKEFLPSTGRLSDFSVSLKDGEIRLDTGVKPGSEISVYYDPMLAKLISHGSNRKDSIEKLKTSLEQFFIKGVKNNLLFLIAILNNKSFQKGFITTNFIDREWPSGFSYPEPSAHILKEAAAIVTYIHRLYEKRNYGVKNDKKVNKEVLQNWNVLIKKYIYTTYVKENKKETNIFFEEGFFSVQSGWDIGNQLFSGFLNGKNCFAQLSKRDFNYCLLYKGSKIIVAIVNPEITPYLKLMPKKLKKVSANKLISPMPGLLLAILVNKGDRVQEGTDLVIIESMKMENILKADKDSIISEIYFKEGESILVDEVIMDFKNV